MPTNKTLNKTNNNHNYYIDNDKDNNIRKTGDATASIIIILIIIWVIRGVPTTLDYLAKCREPYLAIEQHFE